MKKLLIFLILLLTLSCGEKKIATYSDYVFNPQNAFTRQLKAKYTVELNQIAIKLGEYGLTLQQNGIGFTKGSTCKDCLYNDGDFWLFISLEHEHVDADKNVSLKLRGITVANKISHDTIFALKTLSLERLLNDNNFKGFLVTGNYGVYKNLSERFSTKNEPVS